MEAGSGRSLRIGGGARDSVAHQDHAKIARSIVSANARCSADGAHEIGWWSIRPNDAVDFAVLTGDFNPVHWLPAYARAAGFRIPSQIVRRPGERSRSSHPKVSGSDFRSQYLFATANLHRGIPYLSGHCYPVGRRMGTWLGVK